MAVNKVVFGDETIIDLTSDDGLDPSDLKLGLKCHDRTGEQITGTGVLYNVPTIYGSRIDGGINFKTYDDGTGFLFHIGVSNQLPLLVSGKITISSFKLPDYIVAMPVMGEPPSFRAEYNDEFVECTIDPIPADSFASAYINYDSPYTTVYTEDLIWVAEKSNGKRETAPFKIKIEFNTTDMKFYYRASSGFAPSDYFTIEEIHIEYKGEVCNLSQELGNLETRYRETEGNSSIYSTMPNQGPLYVPINNTSKLKFAITNDNKFVVSIDGGTELQLQGATATFATYGIDIIQMFYLSTDALFIMYNWMTSETARSITYGRVIYVKHDGTIGATGVRNMFAVSKNKWNSAANGSVYAGKIFPADFKEGAEWRIGIQYIRDQVTSANVNNARFAYGGVINFYVSTSVSRILLQTVSSSRIAQIGSSCVPSTGANVWFGDTNGNIINCYNMTSASVKTMVTYLERVAANANSQTDSWISANSTSSNSNVPFDPNYTYDVLGRLEDGNYLLKYIDSSDNYLIKYMVYNCKFDTVSNHSQWTLINTITTLQSDTVILLKNNVLVDTFNKKLYQITYNTSNNKYSIDFIGTCIYKLLADDIGGTIQHYTDTPTEPSTTSHMALPTGQYSNLFRGIGGADIVTT